MSDYLLVYLMPSKLLETSRLLKLQYEGIKTIVPCILKGLYEGGLEPKLHIFDEVFTGLFKNVRNSTDRNLLRKVSTIWYYFTKTFHQSMGPRVGNFIEELIVHWFERPQRSIRRNTEITEYISRKGEESRKRGESRKKIDFIIEDPQRLTFMELRTSEHTGGRTAQGSLLDKFIEILGALGDANIVEKYMSKGINQVEMIIAILFSETHELLSNSNYSAGRFNSLVSYVMEDHLIWGRVKELGKNGYSLCDGRTITEGIKSSFKSLLMEKREICLSRGNFKIYFRVLFGDEVFTHFTGKSLKDLIKDASGLIADDVWLFFSLAINEFKIAKEFGKTFARRFYDELSEDVKGRFKMLYENFGRSGNLESYVISVNELIERCAREIINKFHERGEELRLLETNDLIQQSEYLKQVCLASLAIYLDRDVKGDRDFTSCKIE
ncbi:MAG: hypothetical protein QXZ63_06615 [Sulfolobales archaeon]